MTRINLVPPQELSGKHLVAEYRELPRVFDLALFYYLRGDTSPIPTEYVLGTGHVKFFYDKLLFILKRNNDLIDEMHRRGYHTSFPKRTIEVLNMYPSSLQNDYVPTEEALALNRARIKERS